MSVAVENLCPFGPHDVLELVSRWRSSTRFMGVSFSYVDNWVCHFLFYFSVASAWCLHQYRYLNRNARFLFFVSSGGCPCVSFDIILVPPSHVVQRSFGALHECHMEIMGASNERRLRTRSDSR